MDNISQSLLFFAIGVILYELHAIKSMLKDINRR